MIVTVPLRLRSAPNLREFWRVRADRVRSERNAVTWVLGNRPRPALPVVVTLTRVAPRALDSDNAVGCMKACRDAVAAWLGVDDADPRVSWAYGQRKGGVGEYAVEIGFGGAP